ncbi:MAG TPA: hypothetical protein VGC39_00075, partial [Candidatus Methylacidiphilales bacterium]
MKSTQWAGVPLQHKISANIFWASVGLLSFSSMTRTPAAPTSSWTGATSVNWSVNTNWSTLPGNGANLVFGATATTRLADVNNTAPPFPLTSVASITFANTGGSQAFTLTGGGVTLGAGASSNVTILNNNAAAETLNLSAGGTGTPGLTLSLSTYTTQIFDSTRGSGNLIIQKAVSLNGTSIGLQSSGSTGAAATIQFSGVITGTGAADALGSLIIGTNGTSPVVVLSGADTTLGATSNGASVALLGGTVRIQGNTALGTGVLYINATGGQTATISSTGTVIEVANGITALSNFSTAEGGALQFQGTTTLNTTNQTAFTVTNNVAQNSGAFAFGGAIVDGGGGASLTLNGQGITAFMGANTYTGLTTVSGGQTLNLEETAGVLGINTGGLAVDAGSVVFFFANNQISSAATVTINGTGTMNLKGLAQPNSYSETIKTLADDGSGTGTVRLAMGTLTVGNGNFSGTMLGTGTPSTVNLIKGDDGSLTGGTLTISGANTYTGNTELLAGGLILGNNSALGTGTLLMSNTVSGKALTLGSTGSFVIANNISTQSSFTSAEIGTLELAGDVTLDTTGGTTAFTITNNVPQANNTLTISGSIDDGGNGASLTLTGQGHTVFTGGSDNTYTGLTTVSGGQLLTLAKTDLAYAINSGGLTIDANSQVEFQASNEMNSAVTVTINGSGVFNLNGYSQDIVTLADDGSGQGSIRFLEGSQFAVENGSFSGTISDAGGPVGVPELVKTSDGSLSGGTLLISGANTYTAETLLVGGILQAGRRTAFGTGNFANIGGTLELANDNHILTIGGTFRQNSGILALSVYSPTAADQVNVHSTATLGGTLSIDLAGVSGGNGLAGSATRTRSFVLLTSSGLNDSEFGDVTYSDTPANAREMIVYTADDVVLEFTSTATLFPTTSLTPNQQAILGPINNGLTSGNASISFVTLDTALANLYANNPAGLGAALDSLSPQAFAQFTSATAFNNASFETEAMDNYLAGRRDANGNFLAGSGAIDASGLTMNDPSYDPNLAGVHSRLMAWNAAPL